MDSPPSLPANSPTKPPTAVIVVPSSRSSGILGSSPMIFPVKWQFSTVGWLEWPINAPDLKSPLP